MINAGILVDRLKAELTGLKSIAGAAELDAAFDGNPATPSAFVLPMADDAISDIDTLGSIEQDISQVFGVVHVVSNRIDAKGAAALEDLTLLRNRLFTALIGWVPEAETGEQMRFRSGRLLRLDGNGRLWWIDQFVLNNSYWSN